MFYIQSMLIGMISGFIPLLPIMALFHFVMLKKNRRNEITTAPLHIVGVYIFCLALMAIFSVTGAPDLYNLTVDTTINIVPFADIFSNFLQYVLNMILFIPLGFLLPALWKQFKKKHLTFLCGFLITLFIEITQIFTFRTTDIDDLLMNTTGAIIGYFLFMLTRKIFPKISVFAIEPTNHWRMEPYFCFCLAWLTMFLIQPFISDWFWGLILRN